MAESLKSPGQEIIRAPRSGGSVPGSDVGILYILGIFAWGEVGKPTDVFNSTERERKLGGYISGFYGAKAIDLAFMQGGISKVVAIRTAHYANGVLAAKKSAVTLSGYNDSVESSPKANTLAIKAKCEGELGNRLNVSTLKAKTTLAAAATGTVKSLSVADVSGFEVGDVIDISDGTHYFRTVITAIKGGDNCLLFKEITLTNSYAANTTTVKTGSYHTISTKLAAGEVLSTGATGIKLSSTVGVNVSATLVIIDTREAAPNYVVLKVKGISGNTILFDALGTITPIDTANSRVVSEECQIDIYLDTEKIGRTNIGSMNTANEKAFLTNVFKNEYVNITIEPSTENLLGIIPEALENVYLTGGDDGLAGLSDTDFVGSEAIGNGFYAFDALPRRFAQIICPDGRSATVQKALQACAERNRLWFEADTDFGMTYEEAGAFVTETAMLNSEFGRINYPNVKWTNPVSGIVEAMPQSAAVAGLNAAVWGKKTPGYGPWTQPAGVDYPLKGIVGFENDDTVSNAVRDYLYERRINPIYLFPNVGHIVYGIRLLSTAGNYSQVGEAVTFLYVEHSIANDTFWSKFKSIDDSYRGQGMQRIKKFLDGVWRNGGLKGVIPAKPNVSEPNGAYFIDIASLNTTETEEAGEFYWKIGLATKKAGEFIYFVFQRKTED